MNVAEKSTSYSNEPVDNTNNLPLEGRRVLRTKAEEGGRGYRYKGVRKISENAWEKKAKEVELQNNVKVVGGPLKKVTK